MLLDLVHGLFKSTEFGSDFLIEVVAFCCICLLIDGIINMVRRM